MNGKLTLARAWASSRAFWAAARSLATSSSVVDMRSADAAALLFVMLMEAPCVLETTGENASTPTTVLVLQLDVPHMAAVATTAAAVNLLRRFVEGIVGGGIDVSAGFTKWRSKHRRWGCSASSAFGATRPCALTVTESPLMTNSTTTVGEVCLSSPTSLAAVRPLPFHSRSPHGQTKRRKTVGQPYT